MAKEREAAAVIATTEFGEIVMVVHDREVVRIRPGPAEVPVGLIPEVPLPSEVRRPPWRARAGEARLFFRGRNDLIRIS